MSNQTSKAIEQLAAQGYCRIASVFDSTSVKEMLSRVHVLAENNQADAVNDIPRLDTGQETVYNLQNKDFDLLHTLLSCEIVTNVLINFLNDEWHRAINLSEPNYILRSFSARNNLVAAPLHIDSFIPYQGQYPLSMQVAVILEDQDENNGCTIVIPGSHQSGEYVTQDQISNSVPIPSKAGDVVIWDSRIWHGTLVNNSGASRWSLIATFVRWWIKQGYQITENLPQAIYQRLNDSEKAILGYCSRPLADEKAGIDFKKGYDFLKQSVDDY